MTAEEHQRSYMRAHDAMMMSVPECAAYSSDDYRDGGRGVEQLQDMITDLLHLAAHNGHSVEQMIESARDNFEAEYNDQE